MTHNVVRGDGQGRVNFEIVRHALAAGIDVVLLADRVAPELVEAGAEWVRVRPWMRQANLLKVWESAWRADRQVARLANEVDVVFGNGFVLTQSHHVNAVHFVHGAWLQSPVHVSRVRRGPAAWYQWLYSAFNSRWEKAALRRAQLTVAVSNKVRDDLVGVGLPHDRIRVILNGVDPLEFRPGAADRAALGLPEHVPLALFAGDIRTPRKNLDTVLRALADVEGLHLAVAGATEGSPYPSLAERLHVSGRVHFLGFRRDVADLMRAADLFVFPSRYEACTLVLLEAMASGLPVVTAETAGGAEVVTPACGVVLRDPDDEEGLAEAMRSIISDPDRRERMATASRAVAEQYTWSRMAEAYLDLFEEAAR